MDLLRNLRGDIEAVTRAAQALTGRLVEASWKHLQTFWKAYGRARDEAPSSNEAAEKRPEENGKILPLRLPRPAPDSKPEDRIAQTLGGVLEALRASLSFTSANVFLLEDGALVQRAYTTKSRAIARLATVRLDQGLLGWVARNARPLFLNDLDKEGRSLGYYARPGAKVGSFAAYPIRAGGKIAGVLAVDDENENAFPEESAEPVLAAIAGLLGHVLEAEGRAQEVEGHVRRLEITQKIAAAAASGGDFEEAAEGVARSALEACGAFSAALLLQDDHGNLRLAGGVGYHDLFARHFKLDAARFIAEQALRQGVPFRLDGAPLAARYRNARAGQAPAVQIAVPFYHKGQGIGAICLDFAAPEEIPDGIEDALAAAAPEIAGNIVRIYEAGLGLRSAEATTADLDAAFALLKAADAGTYWKRFFDLAAEALPGAIGCAAYLREHDAFRPVAVANLDVPSEPVPEKSGFVGWTALAGRPVRIRRSARRDLAGLSGNAFVAFPIRIGDVTQAVVLAAYNSAQAPEEAIEAAERLARIGATTLPVHLRLAEAESYVSRDPETGLWNRTAFASRAQAVLSHRAATLFYLDTVGDVELEEALGHAEVVRLAARIGRIVRGAAPPEAVVGRVGEREFAVLLPTIRQSAVEAAAQRIEETVDAARVGGDGAGRFGLRVSIGISQADRVPARYESLLQVAESLARANARRGRAFVVNA